MDSLDGILTAQQEICERVLHVERWRREVGTFSFLMYRLIPLDILNWIIQLLKGLVPGKLNILRRTTKLNHERSQGTSRGNERGQGGNTDRN